MLRKSNNNSFEEELQWHNRKESTKLKNEHITHITKCLKKILEKCRL